MSYLVRTCSFKDEEDCGVLAGLGEKQPGFWNDDQCDHSFGVLCKSNVSPSFPDPPQLPTCLMYGRPEFFLYKGSCYKWMDEPKTWDDAEQNCMFHHAHLVSITSDVEQAYVFTQPQLGVEQGQAWIGLSNKEVSNI